MGSREYARVNARTPTSERSAVQGLIVHGRIIGEDVAVGVIMIPAGTVRAAEGVWLGWRG